MTRIFSVPFGRGTAKFTAPPWACVASVETRAFPAAADPCQTIARALANPIGCAPLSVLAQGKRNVCIAVTDATRLCPDHLLVPPMLRELDLAGVPTTSVTILVAVGTHRKSTDQEKREKLGDDIVDRYQVIDHDPYDPDELRDSGVSIDGVPVFLSRYVLEADLVLATGRVEPHQYAGYSGGGKTVAIGCAAEPVIGHTHGPAMLDRPRVRLGVLNGNPFQEAVREVAAAAHVAFVANCVLDDDGRLVAAGYGSPAAVQDLLAQTAERMYVASIPGQVDIAVAGVGYPKDQNAYQASRAASYLQYAPTPVVRSGGVIIVPAACPEGPGEGVGEQRFFAAMTGEEGRAAFLARVRAGDFQPGEQRAYIMAQILDDVTVIFAGAADPGPLNAMGFQTAAGLDEAWEMAGANVGQPATALVVPHALLTMPVVTPAVHLGSPGND
ncbi:nickel-dependent lactate racemase [soil metagenome]